MKGVNTDILFITSILHWQKELAIGASQNQRYSTTFCLFPHTNAYIMLL